MTKNDLPTLTEMYRQDLTRMYRSKYFNLWFSNYEWDGDVSKDAVYFIMEKYWLDGTVAAFRKGSEEAGILSFGKWVRTSFNEYGLPVQARILNPYKTPGFPKSVTFGIDGVYSYIQADRRSIREITDVMIENILDAEMIVKTHEFIQKMPLLFKATPENIDKLKDLMRKIWRNEPTIFVTELEANAVDLLTTGAPFLLDKLYQYKDQREAELKTYLGLDNSTKMENTIIPNADMVNANNAEINASGDVFLVPMEKFCEEIREVLGFEISVKRRQKPVNSIHDKNQPGEGDDQEDDNL